MLASAQEALLELGILVSVELARVEHFQRDRPPERDLLGLVDFPHSTGSDEGEDPVLSVDDTPDERVGFLPLRCCVRRNCRAHTSSSPPAHSLQVTSRALEPHFLRLNGSRLFGSVPVKRGLVCGVKSVASPVLGSAAVLTLALGLTSTISSATPRSGGRTARIEGVGRTTTHARREDWSSSARRRTDISSAARISRRARGFGSPLATKGRTSAGAYSTRSYR